MFDILVRKTISVIDTVKADKVSLALIEEYIDRTALK